MRRYGLIGLLGLPLVCYAELPENAITSCTTQIGTAEQPTMEGGLINPAEKDSQAQVNTFVTHKNSHKTIKNLDRHFAALKIPDEFNSDKAIKQLLTVAAQDHKLAYVLQRANQLKLPTTVALIPMIESRYQIHAVSPKGAIGAWQLMATTAKYGLEDKKRENFMASTDTALRLLKNLHQQFNNWTLAFAAYHAGSRRVRSVLQQHPHAQFIHELGLPLETQKYIRRLKMLYKTIASYSIDANKLNKRSRFIEKV